MTLSTQKKSSTASWQVKLLYDGDCSICMREVRFLQKKDQGKEQVKLVNIAAEDYSPEDNCGIDYETAMGRIHAILPDGTILKDVAAFRYVYEVLGMGWVYAITKLPIIGNIANWLYKLWAKLRLPLTGRPDLETILSERKNKQKCNQSSCQI